MMLVALALVAALVLETLAFSALLARQSRAHARREDLLLNQLLHATGKPWQPAPAAAAAEPEKREPRAWTQTPEQLPVH